MARNQASSEEDGSKKRVGRGVGAGMAEWVRSSPEERPAANVVRKDIQRDEVRLRLGCSATLSSTPKRRRKQPRA